MSKPRIKDRFAFLPTDVARDGALGHSAMLLLAQMASSAHGEFDHDGQPVDDDDGPDWIVKPAAGWARATGLKSHGRVHDYIEELEQAALIRWHEDEERWMMAWKRRDLLRRPGAYKRIDLRVLARADLPIHVRRLHLVLQSYMHSKTRICSASQDTLARAVNCGWRAVQRSLSRLADEGLIEGEVRPGRTTRWRVCCDITRHETTGVCHETTGVRHQTTGVVSRDDRG